MNYVEPQSDVYLFRGVEWDKTYKHTLLSNEEYTTLDWLLSHHSYIKHQFYSYIRPESGEVKLNFEVETLGHSINYLVNMGYNYIVFVNKRPDMSPSSLPDVTYYAFIDDILYINENSVNVKFTIDVIQTWLINGNGELETCFVEREIPKVDEMGDNLVPENFETGEYVLRDPIIFSGLDLKNVYYWLLCSATLELKSDVTGPYWAVTNSEPSYINGCLTCCNVYNLSTLTGVEPDDERFLIMVKRIIKAFEEAGKTNDIISIFAVPKEFANDFINSSTAEVPTRSITMPYIIDNFYDGSEVYIPRNKKLLTSPYNFLRLYDMVGNTHDYSFEYFNNNVPQFEFFGDISTGSFSMCIIPHNYKQHEIAFDEALSISGAYPTVAVGSSTFREWFAQNSVSLGLSGIASAVSIITGMSEVANVIGSGNSDLLSNAFRDSLGNSDTQSGITGIAGLVSSVVNHYRTPTKMHGQTSGNLLMSRRIEDLKFEHYQIRIEFAKIIDDFFSMYGYATNRVKEPEIQTRQYWTYCKTRGCEVQGEIPNNAKSAISNIFDNGITFWTGKDGIIGKYVVDGEWLINSPL